MIPQNVIPRCLVSVVVVAFFCITYLPASRSFSFSLTGPYGHGFFKPSPPSTWARLRSILHSPPLPLHHPTVQHRPSRFLPVLSKSFCLTTGVLALFLIPHHPLPLLCRIRGRYASITLIPPFHPHAHPHIRLAPVPPTLDPGGTEHGKFLGSIGRRTIPLPISILFPLNPVSSIPFSTLYLNGQPTTIIVARQGFFSVTFLAFRHSSLCSFVFRRCSTFLFILYIASSYCLSFSSNIVDYIVFLTRTTHTYTMAFIATINWGASPETPLAVLPDTVRWVRLTRL